ncbi:MAG: uroporphyrinogen decarboxylase family protein [Candidatus Helarchaeota archaeon]
MNVMKMMVNDLAKRKSHGFMIKSIRAMHSLRRAFRRKEKRDFKDNQELFFQRAERILTALKLKTPDRIPVSTLAGQILPAYHAGITGEEYLFNKKASIKAYLKFIEDFPSDLILAPFFSSGVGHLLVAAGVTFIKLPGIDLDPRIGYQFEEKPSMEAEDYPNFGRKFLIEKVLPEKVGLAKKNKPKGVSLWKTMRLGSGMIFDMMHNFDLIESRGMPVFIGSMGSQPFDLVSLILRGLRGVSIDIRRRPQEVRRICDMVAPALLNSYLMTAKFFERTRTLPEGYDVDPELFKNKKKKKINFRAGVFFVCERSFMFNPKQFQEISFPSLKLVLEGLVENGFVPIVQFEQDVTHLLEIIRELPGPGKIMFSCDLSNILKVKEVVGDKMCVLGNVPSGLLTVGTPKQIDDYCKKLITDMKEIDGGAGFILGPACSLPDEAKLENVKAMIDAGLKYGKLS